ncbi:BON domain-containing protein [Allorhodopirellula solitaria]|uniref:BON domain protein n=1 Tax=Allorhodopirellula solitaria TaxID=2527987 RepID=A0A5C5YJS5_9BACT|nr:BON domain-containing protein [Allorhodopirellula solitaria]TWT75141.1 BON domain protein [Allorhodopirellula solitaria]
MTALTSTAPARYTDANEVDALRRDDAGQLSDERKQPNSPAVSVLAESSVSELRRLRVEESDQSIYLSGRVRSFYHKQLAQEAIRPVADGRQVVNRVDVCDRGQI